MHFQHAQDTEWNLHTYWKRFPELGRNSNESGCHGNNREGIETAVVASVLLKGQPGVSGVAGKAWQRWWGGEGEGRK